MTTFNLADLFEQAVDEWPDREYIVAEGQRRTFAEMDARANRLAHHLAANGIGSGDHVGIYAYNCVEWVEALWACFKVRAVWININYRYVEDELRYLFDNADLKGLVYAREFAPRVRKVVEVMPGLKHTVVIEDGSEADLSGLDSVPYEEALAAESTERDFPLRSNDDRYILYTGGTTGMPKGVVWRHEDVFFALGGGVDLQTGTRVTKPEQMLEVGARPGLSRFLPIAPLMHGATQWSVIGGSFVGRTTYLVARFDAHEVWSMLEAEQIQSLFITGDAMGRPLTEALDEAPEKYDLSSLIALVSTAALFSPAVKDDFFRHLPNLVITESIGSSEGGGNGLTIIVKGQSAFKFGGPNVKAIDDSLVLDEDGKPTAPGVTGKLARRGNVPLGYYKDPKKTAETFLTFGDTRYVIPGDFARREDDGSITLLGRGSQCINSGGEKIYPEEVETALKSHPDVWDGVVIGVPDERWGARVAAVVAPREGRTPDLESIQDHCRQHVAGYKIPRQLHIVEAIERSPSGKPDYRWAQSVTESEA
ncbi:MAG: acyl-CoA synthetase [Deltaproteobacteria bacterium]|nr:acyl-CoA synthetase [Deltaproteobacteria bacterium]MBW2445909.1 acyl-CoA synthetase [Deltaproteobacteria bacterium]